MANDMTSATSSSGFRSKKKDAAGPTDVGQLLGKLPPASLENEVALLGAMLVDNRMIGDVIQVLNSSEDFYKQGHAALYDVLVEMYDRNEPIEMPQLTQRLRDRQILDQVGGIEYIIELAEACPVATSAPYYAQIVREKSLLRRLIDSAATILDEAYSSSEPVAELLDRAEQAIFQLAESRTDSEATQLQALLQELYAQLEVQDGRDVSGLATGYFELDEMTSGLQGGELIIVAARPSMGKTALAINIAEHVAVSLRQSVAVFSLEMSKQQLTQRLLCSRSGVDSQRLRRNMLNEQDWEKLQFSVGELSDAPLYIDDTPGLSLLALRAKARRLAARHDLQMIVIDYLQLMNAPGAESRQQEVTKLSMGIKALARELDVPVICLSQLNRGPESREGHRPRMSDLRESGSIEQDADVVMMLHREDYYHRGEPDYTDTNVSELILAKQRNGPTGTVKLVFDGQTTRFKNPAAGSID